MTKNLTGKCKALCLCLLLFISSGLYAQVVTTDYKNIALSAFLDSLTSKSSINIAYDVNAIPVDSVMDVHYHQVHPLEIVKDVLKNSQVEVMFLNNQIIISESISPIKQKQVIKLSGHVIDSDEGTPLPLVNVSIKHQSLGTITNSEGAFDFKIPAIYKDSMLIFSFLGYHTESILIPKTDSIVVVELETSTVKLDEVEVAYQNPEAIIDHLRDNHRQNYWNKQALLSGFFRESIRQDGEYVQVSEAIVEIIKPSYSKPSDMERVKFIKGRKKNDLQTMDLVDFKLEGGPFQFSRVDIARYHDFFPNENSPYKYAYDGLDILNEQIVYKVRFRPYEDNGALLYSGVLYVHAQSYALLRAEFELTKKALRKSGRSLIRKASRKLKVKPLQAKYYVDYRFYGGRWILNRVDGEIVIHINDKRNKVDSEFSAVTELLISDWEMNKKAKLKSSEVFKSRYILADQIDESDDEFWEGYNIIRPDEELEKVFKKKVP